VDYQRKHPRFPIDTPAIITVLGAEQGAIAARIADLSEGGLRLAVPLPVAVGETLRVEIGDEVFVGVVRNTEELGKCERLVGLELIHGIERDKLQDLLDEFAVGAF
jgi:hypothetical protein